MKKNTLYSLIGVVIGCMLGSVSLADCPNASDIVVGSNGYWVTKDGWKSVIPAVPKVAKPGAFVDAMATFDSGTYPPDSTSVFNSLSCAYNSSSSQNVIVLVQQGGSSTYQLEGIGFNWRSFSNPMWQFCVSHRHAVGDCGFTRA